MLRGKHLRSPRPAAGISGIYSGTGNTDGAGRELTDHQRQTLVILEVGPQFRCALAEKLRHAPQGAATERCAPSTGRRGTEGRRPRSDEDPSRSAGCVEWAPILRQPVKTQFSLNGEESHEHVSKAVHKRIQRSRREAAGTGGFAGRSVTGL
jgi:hypothetical protein